MSGATVTWAWSVAATASVRVLMCGAAFTGLASTSPVNPILRSSVGGTSGSAATTRTKTTPTDTLASYGVEISIVAAQSGTANAIADWSVAGMVRASDVYFTTATAYLSFAMGVKLTPVASGPVGGEVWTASDSAGASTNGFGSVELHPDAGHRRGRRPAGVQPCSRSLGDARRMSTTFFEETFSNGAWRRLNSGTPAVPPTPPPASDPYSEIATVVRTDLAFDVPSDDLMDAGPIVGPHIFESFPTAFTSSQDSPNAPDVDTRFNADGTPMSTANMWHRFYPPGYSTNVEWGGEIRDRPFRKRAVRTETVTTRQLTTPAGTAFTIKRDFRVLDKIDEITEIVVQGGMNTAFMEMLDIPTTDAEYNLAVASTAGGAPLRWRQTVEWYEAVKLWNETHTRKFYLLSMPDGSTNATKAPASLLSNALLWLENRYPGINVRIDGKLVICPTNPKCRRRTPTALRRRARSTRSTTGPG